MADRRVDRGERRARRQLVEIGDEIREARQLVGHSQQRVAALAGWTQHRVSEAERGQLLTASVIALARLAGVVGLDLSVRCFPSGDPIRDAAQVSTLTALRRRLGADWHWRMEVPLGRPGDLRAWDAVIRRGDLAIGVEVVSRLRDVQAVVRAARLKQRDAGIARLLLVVPETHRNRAALAAARDLLADEFPITARAALRALTDGGDPGGDALLVIPARLRSQPVARVPVQRS